MHFFVIIIQHYQHVPCRDVIVPAFPETLLLSQWIATKAIPGKTGANHIPAVVSEFKECTAELTAQQQTLADPGKYSCQCRCLLELPCAPCWRPATVKCLT